MADFSDDLATTGASQECIDSAAGKTAAEFWAECSRGDWLMCAACAANVAPARIADACCAVARSASSLIDQPLVGTLAVMNYISGQLLGTNSVDELERALGPMRTELRAAARREDWKTAYKISSVEAAAGCAISAARYAVSNVLSARWTAENADAADPGLDSSALIKSSIDSIGAPL